MKTLIEHIASQCSAINADAAYDDMLDECFSLESVGGPFAHMSASKVLSEVDPIAYRCGFSDFADSQREFWVEVDGDYYERRDAEQAKEEFIAELQTEAEAHGEAANAAGRNQDKAAMDDAELLFNAKNAEIKEAESFDL